MDPTPQKKSSVSLTIPNRVYQGFEVLGSVIPSGVGSHDLVTRMFGKDLFSRTIGLYRFIYLAKIYIYICLKQWISLNGCNKHVQVGLLNISIHLANIFWSGQKPMIGSWRSTLRSKEVTWTFVVLYRALEHCLVETLWSKSMEYLVCSCFSSCFVLLILFQYIPYHPCKVYSSIHAYILSWKETSQR